MTPTPPSVPPGGRPPVKAKATIGVLVDLFKSRFGLPGRVPTRPPGPRDELDLDPPVLPPGPNGIKPRD